MALVNLNTAIDVENMRSKALEIMETLRTSDFGQSDSPVSI